MKKLLVFLFVLISFAASAQYPPSGTKILYTNGVGVGTKFIAPVYPDSNILYWRYPDSALMAKYKGVAREVAFGPTSTSYWGRSGTTLSPLTAGDSVTTTGGISTGKRATFNTVGIGAVPNVTTPTSFGFDVGTGNYSANTRGNMYGNAFGIANFNASSTGVYNYGFGINNGRIASAPTYNFLYGVGNMEIATTLNNNVAIGLSIADKKTSLINNVMIGSNAYGNAPGTAASIVAVGYNAGYNVNGDNNTFVGSTAASFGSTTQMSNCTTVGYNSGSSISPVSNSTAIGNGATITKSNQVVLGNGSVTEVSTTAILVPYAISTTGTAESKLFSTTIYGSLTLPNASVTGLNTFVMNSTTGDQLISGTGATSVRKGISTQGGSYIWQDVSGGSATIGGVTQSEAVKAHTVTGGTSGKELWYDAANTRPAHLIDYGGQLTTTYFPLKFGANGSLVAGSISKSSTVGLGMLGVAGSVYDFYIGTPGGVDMIFNPTGTTQVGIGNLAGTGSRAVLASATGILSAPVSDSTVKRNINKLNHNQGLGALNKLNPVSFFYKDGWAKEWGTNLQMGLIAQDVEKVFPTGVFTTPQTGKKGIDYNQFWGPIIKSIQELSSQREADIKKISSLEERISRLEKLLIVKK